MSMEAQIPRPPQFYPNQADILAFIPSQPKADAPIGFDETPPDTEMLPTSMSGASAISCYDHAPRTIVPPLTNGGMLRSMDNHELADWLSTLAENTVNQEPTSRWGRRDFFNWLSEPVNGNGTRR